MLEDIRIWLPTFIIAVPTRADITSADEGYLAICLAVKDQAEDVREWALHHLNLGVSKIYILEHNSTRPALPEIQDLVHAGNMHVLCHLPADLHTSGATHANAESLSYDVSQVVWSTNS